MTNTATAAQTARPSVRNKWGWPGGDAEGRVTVTVPRKFYDDHIGRDCGENDRVVKETARTVQVSLDVDGWTDLFSDADLYSDPREFPEYRGLVRSAQATVRAMTKAAGA